MSVGILISYKKQSPDTYVPVVSEQGFHASWKPLFTGLELTWLPLLSTGFPILPEDLPEVLEELEKVMGKSSELPEAVQERILRANETLSKVDWNEVAELFFG